MFFSAMLLPDIQRQKVGHIRNKKKGHQKKKLSNLELDRN